MRTTRAALTLLVVSATFALSVPSAGSAPRPPEVLRLTWLQTSNRPHGKKGAWTSRLVNAVPQLNKPAGTPVGGEVGFSHGSQYVGAIKLPGGVLEYLGKAKHLPRNAGIVVPVVDGSGNFEGVRGTYTRYFSDHILVLQLRYE